ncbi:ammonium transporter [Henriciella litoralis]|uniref:ammonium transporter n=1 Tax=Henriciella litoralis TaxID=568102 RepID=UPI0009FE19D0|nr:ammonium transporter [Henriciella litoralis]
MKSLIKGSMRGLAVLPFAALGALSASAQEISEVSAYVDNSYLFLIGGLIVMFMAAGFCMLEAGLVRKKNAAMQSMKNVALFSVAGIMVWLVGYNMAYPSETILGGWLGIPTFFWSPVEDLATGYAASSDWFFQMVFVATAASIVSGTVAERVKLWPFLIFTVFLTAFIYPVVASWEWGGGALDAQFGFSDFAGSTLVHSTGGWAALVGAIIIGPRIGKFVNGQVHPMPGSNIPLAALGTFILWFGWFGFNGASQLAAGSFDDINAVSKIFANTNMAACGGVIAAMILTAILYKGKVDATMCFNGAIGGLVSITAEPLAPTMGASILIGAVGGILVVLTVPLLDKLKIDDVVGAIPAHLVCGIWGTIIVAASYGNAIMIPAADADGAIGVSYMGQLIGVIATGIFVSAASAIVWFALKATVGVRPSEEDEIAGMDKAEVGLEAYPEFS